ncbi:Phosphoglycolate phosphatase [Candidatus Izimaplasma bacterium HR1]|jgi:FMN phosphatase YigB (HAD superfamily)|uniref:HAD family hydrolase n=1 Tax=Candidatus Izimoplasma sp. HR1 TaxID=1541959 RepID=UPI0004F84209|nr:Phosphoglycolate phosphatase [Candidatus Izimaplasma bacterium HR1]
MRDTFLFDLDGTLLPMDFDKFMELYFYNLGVHFNGKIDPRLLAKYIMAATNQMVLVKNNQTNEEKFMKYFGSLIDGDIDVFRSQFDIFYDTLFENVKPSTYQNEAMIKSVKVLKEKGYKVVIATNPLFPIKANYHRIRWAGLNKDDFEYISSFEGNQYTKPHLEFYHEVLNSINKKPEECYMVGNDVFDDLPAKKIGLETYLITDCLINSKNIPIDTNHQGEYDDFYQFVSELKPINTTK